MPSRSILCRLGEIPGPVTAVHALDSVRRVCFRCAGRFCATVGRRGGLIRRRDSYQTRTKVDVSVAASIVSAAPADGLPDEWQRIIVLEQPACSDDVIATAGVFCLARVGSCAHVRRWFVEVERSPLCLQWQRLLSTSRGCRSIMCFSFNR